MLTIISDEEILRVWHNQVQFSTENRLPLVAQAQLEADQEKVDRLCSDFQQILFLKDKEHDRIVREIFEGIRDIFDELYPPPLPNPGMPLSLWYRIQALKDVGEWLFIRREQSAGACPYGDEDIKSLKRGKIPEGEK